MDVIASTPSTDKVSSLFLINVKALNQCSNAWQLTVIYFAKLELVGILKVIRLRNDFQPYHWTSWASRISEKMKKANEGREGQTKARE